MRKTDSTSPIHVMRRAANANVRKMDQTQRNRSTNRSRRNGGPHRLEASIKRVSANIIEDPDRLDNSDWMLWRASMGHILTACDVIGYVRGQIPCPDPTVDPDGANNWAFNDCYAKDLIRRNIESTQLVHIKRCTTAHEMWKTLEALHEHRDYQTMLSYVRLLLRTKSADGDDILEHLADLNLYWDRICLNEDFNSGISELHFRVIICSSLPPSWDAFISPYIQSVLEGDSKKDIGTQEFLGILRREYVRRENRKREREVAH
jgi:hypothetical protein